MYLVYTDIASNVVLFNGLLVENRRRAFRECIALQLGRPLIWRDVVPLQCSIFLGDDRHIHVGTGSQIVEDTSKNCVAC